MSYKNLTIVNRHYPPNTDVTGESAWDLVRYLIQVHGVNVQVVHTNRDKHGGGRKREPIGQVHKVNVHYLGRSKVLRRVNWLMRVSLGDYWESFLLIRKAKKISKGPIVVMTSPMILPSVASLMFIKDWILWSMDLLPVMREESGGLSFARWFKNLIIKKALWNVPSQVIALGPGQKHYLEARYGVGLSGQIIPCGLFLNANISDQNNRAVPDWRDDESKIYFGYCGNCGIRHDPEFVKSVIDMIDAKRHQFILAVYGVFADEIKNYAEGNPGVIIVDNVDRGDLAFIDVHLVSLLASATHLSVPSKSISCVCSGAAIVFKGHKDSDSWRLVKQAGYFIADGVDFGKDLRSLMVSITKQDIVEKRREARALASEMRENMKRSYDVVASWAR